MQELATLSALSEPEFVALIDEIADDPSRRDELTDLLREDHSLYQQRGTATTARMRGWILLALARVGVSDAALLFVLEELDTGTEPYLVAAAARALRSYPTPKSAFAGFVMRAISNVRYRDEPVALENYGRYATSAAATSAVRELLATLTWLGAEGQDVVEEVESLRAPVAGLPKKMLPFVDQAIQAIRAGDQNHENGASQCCALPSSLGSIFFSRAGSRRDCAPIEETLFQDHEGASVSFREFFRGHVSIVVFFYTRCDNPLKCSLTITKLARVQKLLEERCLAGQIRTAAITYDPGFDLPDRLHNYGQSRGLRLDAGNRMLRTTSGFTALSRHFKLGVNFVESLVNRHRVEAYVLDAEGRIASCFERIHWDEQQLVDRAIEVMNEKDDMPPPLPAAPPPPRRNAAPQVLGLLASIAIAFFPKCPMCWAGYLSMFGIATLEKIPYSPWLQPLFFAVMLVNLASVWFRRHSTGGMITFALVSAGALAILSSKFVPGWEAAATAGVALTLAGSLLSAFSAKNARVTAQQFNQA